MTRNQGLEPLDIGVYLCENVSDPRSAVNTSEGLAPVSESTRKGHGMKSTRCPRNPHSPTMGGA